MTIRRSSEKRWAILFTRAVHIEIVPSMDTGSCVMGIERFIVIARRSMASVVWSGYGTIFVRAEKVLLLCLENWNRQAPSLLEHKEIKWKYNPPGAQLQMCFLRNHRYSQVNG